MSRPLTGALIRVKLPVEGQPGVTSDFIGWVDVEDYSFRRVVEMHVIDPDTSPYREGDRVIVERDIAEAGEFIRQPTTEVAK